MPKTHMFAPGERRNVEIWVVAGYHRNLLFTDDSFQFARAMRQVQTMQAGKLHVREVGHALNSIPLFHTGLQIHTHFATRVKDGVDDHVAHDDHEIQVCSCSCDAILFCSASTMPFA